MYSHRSSRSAPHSTFVSPEVRRGRRRERERSREPAGGGARLLASARGARSEDIRLCRYPVIPPVGHEWNALLPNRPRHSPPPARPRPQPRPVPDRPSDRPPRRRYPPEGQNRTRLRGHHPPLPLPAPVIQTLPPAIHGYPQMVYPFMHMPYPPVPFPYMHPYMPVAMPPAIQYPVQLQHPLSHAHPQLPEITELGERY